MDGGAWQAAVHGVTKSWTWLSDFTFTFHFHALEKEMAAHSSVLAWRIPGMGDPGGLLSMGSHRVRHDWSDLTAAAAAAALIYSFIYFQLFFEALLGSGLGTRDIAWTRQIFGLLVALFFFFCGGRGLCRVWKVTKPKETNFVFLAIPCGMWSLSSPTRDQTRSPFIGNMES